MSRKLLATSLYLLCIAGLTEGCRVYDPALLANSPHVPPSDAPAADGARIPKNEAASGDAGSASSCGDGRVDESERCDVAIPRGQPGACPESCNGHDGCFKQHLAGEGCSAHCEEVAVDQAIDGDGCCPANASAQTDDDCSPSCGNNVIEHGESCDPPASCPPPEACASNDACTAARYSGAPELCSAKCELHPRTACENGDGCCPAGCNSTQDDDCPREPTNGAAASGSQAGSGASPATSTPARALDSGAGPPDAVCGDACAPEGDSAACLAMHAAGVCEACDCTACTSETLACLGDLNLVSAEACAKLIDCATTYRCTSVLECYCGAADLGACERVPLGACVDVIRSISGPQALTQVLLSAASAPTSLSRATQLLTCRAQHCADACGLE